MFAEERKNKIMEILHKNKRVSIEELVEIFKVSGATLRTDLRMLEKSGQIMRTHGGALLNEDPIYNEDSISSRKNKNLEQKVLIAQKAREFIEDGDTILLDSGTTSFELAKLLKDAKDATVITNDLQIALELQKSNNIYIIMIGGRVRNSFECTIGSMGVRFLEQFSVDKAFITTNALSMSKGATTPSVENAEIKQAMAKLADKVYLLCDSSKIGKRTVCSFSKIDSFDCVITDNEISQDTIELIENQGTKVIVC